MALASDYMAWPPPGLGGAAREDHCAANPSAPPKRWIYQAPAIGFVLSGWFEYRSEGRTVLLTPGAIVLGNSGEPFSVRHLDERGNTRLVVQVPEALLEEIAAGADSDSSRFPAIALPPSQHTTRMFALMRTLLRGDGAEDCLYPLAHAAFTASRKPERDRISLRDRQRIRLAVQHIEARFGEPCSLQILADIANLSRYHFVRVFSAVIGQSPNQYLINTRVRAAAERLLTTSAPIANIAFDVGFNDISHFYACFGSAFGCTPRQWRGGMRPRRLHS